jgi:hypothetical protein
MRERRNTGLAVEIERTYHYSPAWLSAPCPRIFFWRFLVGQFHRPRR